MFWYQIKDLIKIACAWKGMNYESANLPCLTLILEGKKPVLSANHGELTVQLHSDVKGLTN